MTADELIDCRGAKLRLVIFDCDGVLVDSEPIASRVTADALTLLGWPMTPAESLGHFLGMSMDDMVVVIEKRLGRTLPPGWRQQVSEDFVAMIRRDGTAIPGAVEALEFLAEAGIPFRVASNSSHPELGAKFARLGLTQRVAGRLHSHHDVPRGKPAPDIYLAAAAAEGVTPAECLVIEDSVTGARAAVAAGMDCLGYAPHGDGAALAAVGAVPFVSMFDLPRLLRKAVA